MAKRLASDLAILGGQPAFADKLHVGQPNIGNRERLLERFNDMLDRKWLTNNGPYVQEFEQHIADMTGVKHCIAVCNATVGLEIAIRALGMTGEVIVPSFTFVATAHALQWQEITPVFCDVDPRTHTIDPRQVERLITPRTTGIVGVHLWGRPCDVESLEKIARRRNLKLLFDAAHAVGCAHRGTMIGNFGNAEVFSFHATKFVNALEGGAIMTNDDDLAARIRLMTNFGFAGYDQVVYVGTNGKMNEASAAMGLTSLESIDHFVAINRANYDRYARHLRAIPGLRLITHDPDDVTNYQYVIVEVDEQVTGLSRDRLQQLLWAENGLARRYFYPGCHRMEPYRSYFPHADLLLPNTEALSARVIALPTGMGVSGELCGIIAFAMDHAEELFLSVNGHVAA